MIEQAAVIETYPAEADDQINNNVGKLAESQDSMQPVILQTHSDDLIHNTCHPPGLATCRNHNRQRGEVR